MVMVIICTAECIGRPDEEGDVDIIFDSQGRLPFPLRCAAAAAATALPILRHPCLPHPAPRFS